ncbi:hypothetical protein CK516_21715 [Nostoc sp. 'Peltigera malacea cyanobiont' DB3992]|nr:hypothetical protein CK516_21715 [Nostoc sp. 'Peltigera malacea cyanobiont' DB3992]
MFLLIPLYTVLDTAYLSKKSINEIAYFAAISLILNLVLASWQIQLRLLIMITNRFCEDNESKQ